jgi:hypothetical protein
MDYSAVFREKYLSVGQKLRAYQHIVGVWGSDLTNRVWKLYTLEDFERLEYFLTQMFKAILQIQQYAQVLNVAFRSL